jgi:FMN phosphatase YigB (HAD superfamily)
VLAATKARGDLVIAPELTTGELLAWALRRVHAGMLWAAQQAEAVPEDKFWVEYLDGQGNVRVEPNKWFLLERSMRDEAVKLAARMVDLGLAERMVQVEEAHAVMVASAMREACEAAGVPPEQVVRVGEELRRLLEAGAVQDPVAA